MRATVPNRDSRLPPMAEHPYLRTADATAHRRSQNEAMLSPTFAAPDASDHWQGKLNAALTLVEYGDYECPSCIQAEPLTRQLVERYQHRLVFVFRHFPLIELHPHAAMAAEAAEAAAAQAAFWPMHHALFRQRQHLERPALSGYASEIGLDLARFDQEMDNRLYAARVLAQHQHGVQIGLRATPTFLLNGGVVDVSFGLNQLEARLRHALNPP